MPRITITLSHETLSNVDALAARIKRSRSTTCSALLDMAQPIFGHLAEVYEASLKGPDSEREIVGVIGEILHEATDQYESLKGAVMGASGEVSEGANPRSCNNGGQVSPSDSRDTPQPSVFSKENSKTSPMDGEGGQDA